MQVPLTNMKSVDLLKPRYPIKKWLASKDAVAKNITARKSPANIETVIDLHTRRCDVLQHLQRLQQASNQLAKNMSSRQIDSEANTISPHTKKNEIQSWNEEGKRLKKEIQSRSTLERQLRMDFQNLAQYVPNDTHPQSPLGSESAAHIKYVHRQNLSQEHKTNHSVDHLTFMQQHDLIDLDTAARVSGTNHYYLKGEATLLESALIHYALQYAHRKGFQPIITPDIIREEYNNACGYAPRSSQLNDMMKATNGNNVESVQQPQMQPPQQYLLQTASDTPRQCLSATSEIPLAALHSKQCLSESSLPRRLVAFGRAYRNETGHKGAQNKGLYRVHQFSKIELFAVTTPQSSERMMEEILSVADGILKSLGLTFRVLEMPSEELGASAYRKWDIEAWMPGRGEWGEVASISNCTDHQARRLEITYNPTHRNDSVSGHDDREASGDEENSNDTSGSKVKIANQNGKPFVHTLNGTAIAVPRIIIALIEQHRQVDGTVKIPEALRPLLGFATVGKAFKS